MIDRAKINVKAGDGGNGVISFRREKFVPYGGPDGGDGGNGGNIVLKADHNVTTLADFQHRKFFKAERGGNGKGKKMHGKTAVDLIINVPAGTLVKDAKSDTIIADLIEHEQSVIVARGGIGGYGNIHYVSSTQKAPYVAQKGEAGEEKDLQLDLKLLADVGIVGLPNAGKSTLLGSISNATPKIGSYQFTTLEPNLGVVNYKGKSFVVADIPGIIEGAHLGRGLGHDFLRHIERTRVLVYLLDGNSEDPKLDLKQLKKEMRLYNKELINKTYLVAINKIDIPEVVEKIKELKKKFRLEKSLVFISAVSREGLIGLLDNIIAMLTVKKVVTPDTVDEEEFKVFHPVPIGSKFEVQKTGNVFVLTGEGVERATAMVDYDEYEARPVLMKQLARMGAIHALKHAGLKTGDTIKIGEIELVWTEK
ncbi:MAG: GTPase ObgE [Chloroflexi bacterium]|nr:GTPase ObgE [Chloroflexota bacterium]